VRKAFRKSSYYTGGPGGSMS